MGSTGVAGSEYLSRLFSYQENLYDGNLEIHLDSEASLRALKEMIEIKPFTSKDYCSWWTDTAERFADGDFAMAPLYTNYASSLLNPESKIVDKIGYAMMPGSNPLIGGGSLGVSKYSEHPEDAFSFIKWMCSEPISSAASFLGSTSPCKFTYDNYEVIHNFPWLNLSQKCFVLAKGKRIPENALRNAQAQFEKYFPSKF